MHGSMGSRPSVDPTRLKPVYPRNSVESRAGGEKKRDISEFRQKRRVERMACLRNRLGTTASHAVDAPGYRASEGCTGSFCSATFGH